MQIFDAKAATPILAAVLAPTDRAIFGDITLNNFAVIELKNLLEALALNAANSDSVGATGRLLLGAVDAAAGRATLGAAGLSVANTFGAAQLVNNTLTIQASGYTSAESQIVFGHTSVFDTISGKYLRLSDSAGSGVYFDEQLYGLASGSHFAGLTSSGAFSGLRLAAASGVAWTNQATPDSVDTRLFRPVAGQVQLARLGTNGSAGVFSLAGPSSTGTLRDVAILTGGYATSTDATRQGRLSLGVYGIVSSTETLQTGLTITAQSGGVPVVTLPGGTSLVMTNGAFSAILTSNFGNLICSGEIRASGYRGDYIRLGGSADACLYGAASGLVEVNDGSLGNYRDLRCRNVRTMPVAVASLPAAATAGVGAHAFVADATATTRHSVVAGGGSNKVPVFSDGTDWLIS